MGVIYNFLNKRNFLKFISIKKFLDFLITKVYFKRCTLLNVKNINYIGKEVLYR